MEYTLKRSERARTMRLAVHQDGVVVVTAPSFFGLTAIERFVAKHSRWIEKHVGRARGRTVLRVRRSEIVALKKRALALASARLAHFATIYNLSFGNVSIRAQKSRWGSCSHKRNLSFNYKIAALPPRLADYIIVHELCHCAEMNHSKKFWELVAHTTPDHKKIRKELRALAILFD